MSCGGQSHARLQPRLVVLTQESVIVTLNSKPGRFGTEGVQNACTSSQMCPVPSKRVFSTASWTRIGISLCRGWLRLKELFQNINDDIGINNNSMGGLSLGLQTSITSENPPQVLPGLRHLLASILMLYRHPIIRTNKAQHLLPAFSAKKKSVVNLWVQLCIEVEMSAYKRTCYRKGAPVTFVKAVTLNNYE